MQVNDKNIIYEISKQLPRPAENTPEQIKERPLDLQNKAKDGELAGKDAIVDFSPELKGLETIREIITSQPEVRHDKVAELKAKIEAGEYDVDHEALADKMVDFFINEGL